MERNVCHMARSPTLYSSLGACGKDKEYNCSMFSRARANLEFERTVMILIQKEYVVRRIYVEFLVFLWKICDV